MDALDDLALLQLRLRHPADAVRREVGVPSLDASEAAEVLVSLLLPLGDQVLVGDLVLQAVVVQLCNIYNKVVSFRQKRYERVLRCEPTDLC